MPQHYIHTLHCYKRSNTNDIRNINIYIYNYAALQNNPYGISFFEHYKNMFQNNVNKNKTCLLGSIYSNRNRDPTPPSETSVKHVLNYKNITLNVDPFPLGLIAVLSGRCQFSVLI
jgi:hypothetical protein